MSSASVDLCVKMTTALRIAFSGDILTALRITI